ncbi:hypothetical protein NERG_02451 [Nematocida ausubeli]|uniref:Uncharacterized protein n=1 Tax=Nematocida ausubeli (strain ATCC PRA-371 / ERTm2) TaxID=1913371 RepID=H8ZFT0_NEMA1|nr:hypothetical protein NERG_02451 [Nematocida ausubeli]
MTKRQKNFILEFSRLLICITYFLGAEVYIMAAHGSRRNIAGPSALPFQANSMHNLAKEVERLSRARRKNILAGNKLNIKHERTESLCDGICPKEKLKRISPQKERANPAKTHLDFDSDYDLQEIEEYYKVPANPFSSFIDQLLKNESFNGNRQTAPDLVPSNERSLIIHPQHASFQKGKNPSTIFHNRIQKVASSLIGKDVDEKGKFNYYSSPSIKSAEEESAAMSCSGDTVSDFSVRTCLLSYRAGLYEHPVQNSSLSTYSASLNSDSCSDITRTTRSAKKKLSDRTAPRSKANGPVDIPIESMDTHSPANYIIPMNIKNNYKELENLFVKERSQKPSEWRRSLLFAVNQWKEEIKKNNALTEEDCIFEEKKLKEAKIQICLVGSEYNQKRKEFEDVYAEMQSIATCYFEKWQVSKDIIMEIKNDISYNCGDILSIPKGGNSNYEITKESISLINAEVMPIIRTMQEATDLCSKKISELKKLEENADKTLNGNIYYLGGLIAAQKADMSRIKLSIKSFDRLNTKGSLLGCLRKLELEHAERLKKNVDLAERRMSLHKRYIANLKDLVIILENLHNTMAISEPILKSLTNIAIKFYALKKVEYIYTESLRAIKEKLNKAEPNKAKKSKQSYKRHQVRTV